MHLFAELCRAAVRAFARTHLLRAALPGCVQCRITAPATQTTAGSTGMRQAFSILWVCAVRARAVRQSADGLVMQNAGPEDAAGYAAYYTDLRAAPFMQWITPIISGVPSAGALSTTDDPFRFAPCALPTP
jgi:hypothetical protein